MRPVRKSPEPASLTWERNQGQSYEGLNTSTKRDIRRAMWTDQAGVCVYCERAIDGSVIDRDDVLTNHYMIIEHYHPRSNGPWTAKSTADWKAAPCSGPHAANSASHQSSRTEWSNLLLSCPGTGVMGEVGATCDSGKGDTDICGDFINPAGASSARIAEIDETGHATPFAGAPPNSAEVIDHVLNLNHDDLVYARREVLARYRRTYLSHGDKLSRVGLRRVADAVRLMASTAGTQFPSSLLRVADELDAAAAGLDA